MVLFVLRPISQSCNSFIFCRVGCFVRLGGGVMLAAVTFVWTRRHNNKWKCALWSKWVSDGVEEKSRREIGFKIPFCGCWIEEWKDWRRAVDQKNGRSKYYGRLNCGMEEWHCGLSLGMDGYISSEIGHSKGSLLQRGYSISFTGESVQIDFRKSKWREAVFHWKNWSRIISWVSFQLNRRRSMYRFNV